MTRELFYLLLTATLTGVLWIPVVIGYVMARGPLKPQDYVVPPTSPLPHWTQRAVRTHLNAVENLVPFAAVVLVGHAAGISTPTTAACAAVYFYARLAHVVVHISGFSRFMARTMIFTVGWVAFITFAIVLLRHAA